MLSFFKPVAFNLIGDKAACDKSFRGTKKDTPFLKKTLLAGLTVLLFHSPFPSYAELLPIDIQAVTLDYSKPEDDILRFFLKELAKTAYEEGHYSNVLTDPKMFDVFFRNFTYKPDYLIDKIPLKKTSTISKMIQATLRDLIPHYAEAILTADKEYFLFCNTIRGNHILCITKKPLFQPLYEDLHHELFLSILTVKNFLNNILREPVYFESLQNTPSFGRLLLQEVQPVKSPSFSDINLPYFIETLPSLGYDVASLANEARFFKGETEQEREWCFYSLPIVQYAVRDKKQLNHFFFKLDDPVSLKQILELLTNENGKGATLLKKHIQSYISLKQNHEFPTMNPHEKFSEFFENLHYSINYDAIPAAHTSKLYQNVINYILSQGISNFNELSKNKEMIITVINKFFTLGTTYFFRHWSMLSDFPDHLSDAIKEARSHKRPLKVSVFACSTGEEVLTIAFSFLDKGITDFTILGSDINEAYIEQAKKMTYAMQNFERIPDNIRGPVIKKYFKKNGDGNYEIKDKDFFNRRISYIVLDITKPLPSDLPKEWAPPYDLISCQNIFLYLSDKFVSRLYKNLLKLLNENGLFILVDKIYSHNLLKKCNLSRKTLHINDIIIKLIPQKMTDQQIYQSLKEINKEGPYSFAAIRQINDLALFNPPQKRAWFKELMHQKGDRSLIYYLVGKNNLKLGAYSEAEEVLTKGIWQSPYLLNNYWMLEEVKKKLGKKSDAEYLNVISKAIKLFYSNRAYKDLTEILNLFQKAIKKEPDNMLGFYVFGYQLIRYGLFLKDNNGSLLDYERFFNQAYKNLSYVKSNSENHLWANRGMAEIALILNSSYHQMQNSEIADRLIYNALVNYEPEASQSEDMTVLYLLAQLQSKMGAAYLHCSDYYKSYHSLKKAIDNYKKIETCLFNYQPPLCYELYVDFAECWYQYYHLLKQLKLKQLRIPTSEGAYYPKTCLTEAMNNINKALTINSVYGIRASDLRENIFNENAEMRKDYEASFMTD